MKLYIYISVCVLYPRSTNQSLILDVVAVRLPTYFISDTIPTVFPVVLLSQSVRHESESFYNTHFRSKPVSTELRY
jgi:hypothetical protein